MSSSPVLSAIKIRLGQKVTIAINGVVVFLQHRCGHVGHASDWRGRDLAGAESPANAGASSLESRVRRRELCRILLDPHQLLRCPASRNRRLGIRNLERESWGFRGLDVPFGGRVEATIAELPDCGSKLGSAILFCAHHLRFSLLSLFLSL